MTPARLILASGSPRRLELLRRLDLDFAVVPPDVDETPRPGEEAAGYVSRLADEKSAAVSDPDALVIAADTAVVLDGHVMGKPVSDVDARQMLERLSGRRHEVITGVSVRLSASGRSVTGTETTVVSMADISRARVDWYVSSGEGADKAGAYALQGAAALFADRVDGSVSNVIGLPMTLLDRLCADVGTDLLSFRRRS